MEMNSGMMPAAGQENVVNEVPVNKALKITDLNDLKEYSKGTIVTLPEFGEGQPFVARVRRPSMLVLAKQGKIPNSLLTTANELFTGGGGAIDQDNEKLLAEMYDVCMIICEACLIEPSLEDIKDAGMELSDDQIMAIFNYTQNGVKALESFREE